MTVTKAYTVEHGVIDIGHAPPMLTPDDSRSQMFIIGNLCNHAHSDRGKYHGQATEVALMNAVTAVGLSDQRKVTRLFPCSLWCPSGELNESRLPSSLLEIPKSRSVRKRSLSPSRVRLPTLPRTPKQPTSLEPSNPSLPDARRTYEETDQQHPSSLLPSKRSILRRSNWLLPG